MLTYSFSTSSFMNELWINGKRVFKKPTGASVEFTNGGAFDWVFADSSGKVVKTYRDQNPRGGWGHVGNQAGRRRVFVVNWLDGRGPSRRQTAPPGVLRPHEQPSRFFAASRSRRSKNSAEQQVAEPTNLAIIPAICLGQLTGTHARNLSDADDGFLRGKKYLLMDRDTKFSEAFRSTLEQASVRTIRGCRRDHQI